MVETKEFVDAEEFMGGVDDKFNFRLIVLEHLRRILTIASKEFRGGYWERRPISANSNSTLEIYRPDTREEYINAVDSLHDICFPYFDEDTQKEIQDYESWATKKDEELFLTFKQKVEDKEATPESYKTEKVRTIKRRLFRILNKFLHKKNYFSQASYEE